MAKKAASWNVEVPEKPPKPKLKTNTASPQKPTEYSGSSWVFGWIEPNNNNPVEKNVQKWSQQDTDALGSKIMERPPELNERLINFERHAEALNLLASMGFTLEQGLLDILMKSLDLNPTTPVEVLVSDFLSKCFND